MDTTNDLFTAAVRHYGQREQEILAQAQEIMEQRLVRYGAIKDPSESQDLFRTRLGGLPFEEFHVAFLDTRHNLIAVEMINRGGIDGAEVNPRTVVLRALYHNAAALILAHNHPSGNSAPSAADKALTARLKSVMALLEIRILDHIIVGATVTSMAERGDM